jgi:hypothetical protein
MTNTKDNDPLFVPTNQSGRPVSHFPRDIIAMQQRLDDLTAATATGADEDLRRSRIIDLRLAIEAAIVESDAQRDVETDSVEEKGMTQAPRHMTSIAGRHFG